MPELSINDAINLGLQHQNKGELTQAQNIYEAILRAQPDHAITLYLLGRLKYSLKFYEEAAVFLKKSAEKDPGYVDTWIYFGHTLTALDRPVEALQAYQQAAMRAPDNPKAFIPLLEALNRHAVRSFPSPHGDIRFACLGALPLHRGETLLTKEPETLEWIDSFDPGDVFWDVGANVGVYTLYAARAARAGRILAFEPAAENYMLLNRNIEANRVDSRVQAYCLAFNDCDRLDSLHMQTTEPGGALSSFADPVSFDGAAFVARFRQGMIGLSIDSFIAGFAPPFPNRLKIDVDGIEDKIICGAPATLADPRLKSLSIELDDGRTDYRDSVVALIEAGGLRLTAKRHAAAFDNGAFSKIYNFQFNRP